jgi:sulfatase maturation enzyme AslB (radical SAM superfamily)
MTVADLEVTVNVNENVNVTFQGGEPPFRLRRM